MVQKCGQAPVANLEKEIVKEKETNFIVLQTKSNAWENDFPLFFKKDKSPWLNDCLANEHRPQNLLKQTLNLIVVIKDT